MASQQPQQQQQQQPPQASTSASPAPQTGTYTYTYPFVTPGGAATPGAVGTSTPGTPNPTYYQYPGAATGYWYPYPYAQQQQGQPAQQAQIQRASMPPSGTSTPQPTQRTFNYYQGSTGTTTTTGGARSGGKKGATFHKDLKTLMYGFGDDRNPADDTVNVMEEILIEYIVDVCNQAMAGTRKPRIGIEDLRKSLSRPADAKKLARMEELLFAQEDIKRARKEFDDDGSRGA